MEISGRVYPPRYVDANGDVHLDFAGFVGRDCQVEEDRLRTADLDRVRGGLSEKGIDLAAAEAPPGEHQIRVTVQDSEGRQTTTLLTLKVVR